MSVLLAQQLAPIVASIASLLLKGWNAFAQQPLLVPQATPEPPAPSQPVLSLLAAKSLGVNVGLAQNSSIVEGPALGISLGMLLGTSDGETLGRSLGSSDGTTDGICDMDGSFDG